MRPTGSLDVDVTRAPPEPSLRFAAASLREGFVAPALKLAVFPQHRLLRRRRAERPGALGQRAAPAVSDGVARCAPSPSCRGAHRRARDHPIARFGGFRRARDEITRDYLYLEYQGDDKAFVPTDQLAKISRYVGAGGDGGPPLSKLGGTRREAMKARARRATQSLRASCSACTPSAAVVPVTPSRQTPTGNASSRSASPIQDRRSARSHQLVKADMEAPRPWTGSVRRRRLRQTEVALRAAFKAAGDGKQVLMLVPTTPRPQHYAPSPSALPTTR